MMPLSTRISQPAPKNRSQKERVVEDMMKPIKERVSDAMDYASQFSIYGPEDTFSELTTAQATVLMLFYGLLTGDLPLCEYIAQVRVPQLKSTFLRVWLADDFSFKEHDVRMIFSMLSFLVDEKMLPIPNHIVSIFGGLVQKYDLADCCSTYLLAVFNEIHEQTSGNVKNAVARRKLSSSQNTNNEVSSPDKEKKSLNTVFQRMGSMKLKWFKKRKTITKEVEDEEFYLVTQDDYEDSIDSDSNGCDESEKPSSCSENIQEVSFHHLDEKNSSELIKQKETPGETTSRKSSVVDSEGRTLLHRLAMFGRTEAVSRLLEEDLNPDIQDYSGKTALHWAVQYNHYSTVKMLLKFGANVNARTNIGKTPLCYTSFHDGMVSKIWEIIVERGGTM